MAAELTDVDAGLPAMVEAQLVAEGQNSAKEKLDAGVTIALAALVIQAAQFVYQFYRDQKEDKKAAPEVLKRRLRLALDERGYPDTAQRARVIEAAVQLIERER